LLQERVQPEIRENVLGNRSVPYKGGAGAIVVRKRSLGEETLDKGTLFAYQKSIKDVTQEAPRHGIGSRTCLNVAYCAKWKSVRLGGGEWKERPGQDAALLKGSFAVKNNRPVNLRKAIVRTGVSPKETEKGSTDAISRKSELKRGQGEEARRHVFRGVGSFRQEKYTRKRGGAGPINKRKTFRG